MGLSPKQAWTLQKMGTGNSFGAKKILRLKENFGCNSLRERERDIQRDRQSINRERKAMEG